MKKLLFILISVLGTFSNVIGQSTTGFDLNEGASLMNSPYSTIGGYNTGQNMYTNSSSGYNTLYGAYSGYTLTTSIASVAYGYGSLQLTTTGQYNTALGHHALTSNTIGSYNVAVGLASLSNNTAGGENTGVGYVALTHNTGSGNTGIGFWALNANTTGTDNTALGGEALENTVAGNYNVGVGYYAGPLDDYSNTVSIGFGANATASNMIVLGTPSITVNGGFQPWSSLSDGRFKTNIKEDVSGLQFINLLRPISYTFDAAAYDSFAGKVAKTDSTGAQSSNQTPSNATASNTRLTGFIAQEVEAAVVKSGLAFSGVVAPQNEKDHYWLKYSDFVVPLVKAVQDLSKQIDSLTNVITAIAKSQTSAEQNSRTLPGVQTMSNQSQAILNQNFPNPFSVNTTISMTVPETAQYASLSIYNMQGVPLKSISVSGRGNVTVNISGGELAAGIYLCTLFVDGQLVDTKRMVLTN